MLFDTSHVHGVTSDKKNCTLLQRGHQSVSGGVDGKTSTVARVSLDRLNTNIIEALFSVETR